MTIDLTFANLQAALPEGALTVQGNDILISIRSITGETATALNDAKVSEFIAKLLEGTSQAQETFNRASSSDLNSFPRPIPGIPQRDDSGNWYTALTYTTTVRVPLNLNETSAMPI